MVTCRDVVQRQHPRTQRLGTESVLNFDLGTDSLFGINPNKE
jgi:hypothetical protein